MNKPIQYILCGIPFSGKTTLGKALQEKLGWVHINLDEIKAVKGFGQVSDHDVPDSTWSEMFAEADKRLIESFRSGKNVANETAWVTRKWRDRARTVAAKAGFSTKVIYIKIPEETARKRWTENKQIKSRYNTLDKEFSEYIKEFDPPTEDEDLILYDGVSSVEKWMKNTKLST